MANAKDEQNQMDDRPEQALEEGDPQETGRLQGRLVDERNEEDKQNQQPDKQPGEGEHWESGRQDAR